MSDSKQKALSWRCKRCGAAGVLRGEPLTYLVMREHAKASPDCPFDPNHVLAKVATHG